MLQWIRKHRKALAGISVGAGAFFAAISFFTYKVMAAEETTASMQELTATISMLSTTANDLMKISEKLNSDMKFFKI